MFFWSYPPGTKGYKLFVIQFKEYMVITARSVIFSDHIFYLKDKADNLNEIADIQITEENPAPSSGVV